MPYSADYIGNYLVEQHLLTQEQLKEALEEQRKSKGRIGEILVKKGFITEEDFVIALSKQLGVPYVDIKNYSINPELIKLIPHDVVLKYQAMPINRVMDALTVAMVDPLDITGVDGVKRSCNLTIRPVYATVSGIKETIEKYYGVKEPPPPDTTGAGKDSEGTVTEDLEAMMKEAAQAPVVTLVNNIISQAVEAGASDIHIEPEEKTLYVRFRIDGILQDISEVTKDLEPAVLSRLKIMAEMDIAEKRLPQDGRIKMNIAQRQVDLRVSTMPTIYGENIVIRLLDKSQALFKLEDLGFDSDVLVIFKELIRRPYGIILVTGPTGSGKTTTLYGVLNLINDVSKNILTMEDPIEYVIPRVRQTQVNVRAGLLFATGLRAMLRHDPDVIMIGEIRDKETAEIAIQAALTGHLVFSTLHTNDAASAVSRLIDMGVEPFLVASSLIGVLAQRLARRLCEKCKTVYQPIPEELSSLGCELNGTGQVYKEAGCPVCRKTGYKGRVGIFELLLPDEKIKEFIIKKSPPHLIREYAVSEGMLSLRDDGINKFKRGFVSAAEVLRITSEI